MVNDDLANDLTELVEISLTTGGSVFTKFTYKDGEIIEEFVCLDEIKDPQLTKARDSIAHGTSVFDPVDEETMRIATIIMGRLEREDAEKLAAKQQDAKRQIIYGKPR